MQKSMPPGYSRLQVQFKKLSGVDLQQYKSKQVIRRLNSYLRRIGARDFDELSARISEDPTALDQLKNFITINVSEFFRNPIRFEQLKQSVLPELARRFGAPAIWSAGCSNGCEPYSLSIILEELGFQRRPRVLATDLDEEVLQRAERGLYSKRQLAEVSSRRLKMFFQQHGQNWSVDAGLKARVRWEKHNLLFDPYPSRVHLILCRNVVIYFTDEAKRGIYQRFSRSLEVGGYLLVGGTESIFNPSQFGLETAGPFLYRKIEEANG